MRTGSTGHPDARRVGTRSPGRALRVVLAVCQKMASRPFLSLAKTSCERFSRARARTRSTAGPRRTQERTSTSSTTSGSSGHPSARWQYTLAVRGQTSRALRTRPSPSGSRIR
ncbi:MAG TPA: hypothetical protein VHF91_05685 [Acidimicrobiales bacterium]|nr:hypothetical protein [Acidimicrobiales bacterium]